MNVPNITQGIGSVATLSAQTSGTAAAVSRPPVVRTPAHELGFSFTRLACFDINGDGHIDPRAVGAGGDATLLVGSHEVDLPTYSRTVQRVGEVRASNAKEPTPKSDASAGSTPTTAQTRAAIDAYQRYGQAPSTPSTPSTSTPSTPAAAPAPAPVVSLPTPAVATDTPAPVPVQSAPIRAVA